MRKSRFICFARNCICIRTEDERSAKLADFLFSDVYSARPSDDVHTTIRLHYLDSSETYCLFRNVEPLYVGQSEGELLRIVMDRVVFALADKARGGLLFHAAALWQEHQVVLLPGETGSGKSSLAGWLACRGFGYLTDELVFLPFDAPGVDAFARPLNIKRWGLGVLDSFPRLDEHEDQLIRGIAATLVPHRLLNSCFEREQKSPLGLIVFPKYKRGAETDLQKISAGDAGLRLMEVLVNARNLPGHGLQETSRVAKMAPAYSLVYSEFSDIAGRIRSLLKDGGAATADSEGGGARWLG